MGPTHYWPLGVWCDFRPSRSKIENVRFLWSSYKMRKTLPFLLYRFDKTGDPSGNKQRSLFGGHWSPGKGYRTRSCPTRQMGPDLPTCTIHKSKNQMKCPSSVRSSFKNPPNAVFVMQGCLAVPIRWPGIQQGKKKGVPSMLDFSKG